MAQLVMQFSARVSLSSEMIRGITHGQWSHVDAVAADGELLGARDAPIGVFPAGVRIRPHDYLPSRPRKS